MQKELSQDVLRTIQRLEKLARLFDNRFTLPGTQIGFGLDAIIGLIPVAGDLVSFFISGFILLQAISHRVSKRTLWLMFFNLILDTVIGSIPVVGDVFDVFSRANLKNVRLITNDLKQKK